MDIINNLSTVVFPATGSWMENIFYDLIAWLYGFLGSYGVSIILFTVIIKLIFLPLDFFNKYFTKKNNIIMQELAPEQAKLKRLYPNDQMKQQQELQKLRQKFGYKMGGFCITNLLNILVVLTVFLTMFTSLNNVSEANIKNQYVQTQTVYEQVAADGTVTEAEEQLVIEAYNENNTGFLWIANIWRPETWATKTLTLDEYKEIDGDVNADTYNAVMKIVQPTQQGWNGYLILVVLAGGITWGSITINTKINAKKTKVQQDDIDEHYSVKELKKHQTTADAPAIDPAKMSKIMQLVFPIIMVIFAFTNTAALSIYIITNSIFGVLTTLLINKIIDKILNKQIKKEHEDNPNDIIINPHAKYFKNAKKN